MAASRLFSMSVRKSLFDGASSTAIATPIRRDCRKAAVQKPEVMSSGGTDAIVCLFPSLNETIEATPASSYTVSPMLGRRPIPAVPAWTSSPIQITRRSSECETNEALLACSVFTITALDAIVKSNLAASSSLSAHPEFRGERNDANVTTVDGHSFGGNGADCGLYKRGRALRVS